MNLEDLQIDHSYLIVQVSAFNGKQTSTVKVLEVDLDEQRAVGVIDGVKKVYHPHQIKKWIVKPEKIS